MKSVLERTIERADECYIIACAAAEKAAAGKARWSDVKRAQEALAQAQEAALIAYQVCESKLYWREVRDKRSGEMSRLLAEAMVSSRQAWELATGLR